MSERMAFLKWYIHAQMYAKTKAEQKQPEWPEVLLKYVSGMKCPLVSKGLYRGPQVKSHTPKNSYYH